MQTPLPLWRRLLLLALTLGTGYAAQAQVIPQPLVVTGFNADIVANGTGNTNAGSSSNSSVDANSYVFHSNDYVTTTAPGFFHPNVGLPYGQTFLGAGTATPAVQYRLQPYGSNNSLRLFGVGGGSPVTSAVGTLTLTTPTAAGMLYVLATSGSGSDVTTAVVNFADGTNQSFSFTVGDWFSGTPYAYPVNNRVLITGTNFDAITSNTTANNPRLYQYALALSAANAGKNIASVTFTKSTSTSSYVQIMALSAAPAVANNFTPITLTFPPTGPPAANTSGSASTTTFGTPSANGQDVIVNGTGNTVTGGPATTTTPFANTSATADTDGQGYFLLATGYNGGSASYGLPTNGTLSSLATSGLNYQLADYNGINAVQLRGVGSGGVTFTPTTATEVYVLTLATVSGTVNGGVATVLFGDGTSHSYAISYTNWYTSFTATTATQTSAGVSIGYYGKGRLQPSNSIQTSTTTPYFSENKLLLDASEYGKTVKGIILYNPSATGTVNLLGVTLNSNVATVPQCAFASGHSATASVATACAGTTFNLNPLGLKAAAGYTYQWQYSADNATWSNLTTSTSASPYSTSPTTALCPVTNQTAATYYRCLVQCSFDQAGVSAPSAAVQVGQTDPINCFPYPTISPSGCSAAGSVTAVKIAETATATTVMNKTGLTCGTTTEPYNTYGIYRDANGNGTLDKAKDYTLTVTAANSTRIGVWLDLNRDGVFNSTANSAGAPTGEYFGTTNTTSSTGGALTISIPATALATVTNGAVGLRVRSESGSASILSTAANSNSATTYGVTLDYAVLVTGATPCSGSPTATAPTASTSSACPGSTFTLTAQGPALGTTGLTYQWQYKLSAGGTYAALPASFTDVNGNTVATNQGSATVTIVNQRASTDYRVVITCTASNISAVSPPTTVGQSALANCYCQNSNNATNEYITNVTLGSINNTTGSSQGNTPTGFADYTTSPTSTQTTTLSQGGTYTISVTALSASSAPTEMVWIDYDQSGTFDPSEYTLIGTQSTTGSVTGTKVITIPATALLGATRMRVRFHNDATGTASSACTNAWNGETEDYRVTIGAAQVCSGTPPTTTASASATAVCPNSSVTLSATGIDATITGFTYQWQSSAAGANSFADISGATTNPYTVSSQSAATDYRLVVTCTNSSQSAPSNVVSVGQNNFLYCYCLPTYSASSSSSANDIVTRVQLGTLDNNSTATGQPANHYTDYAPQQTGSSPTLPIPTIYTGGTAAVTITFGSDPNQHGAIWIDFNQSGTFGDVANEYVATTANIGANNSVTLTLNVPAGAVVGTTRLRVRGGDDTNDPTQAQACGASGSIYGEGEDYLVNVASPTVCAGTPPTATAAASVSSVCAGVSFTLSSSGISPAITGLTYQWQSSPAGTNSFSPISGATAQTYTVSSQSAATDYRLVVTCTNGNATSTSNVVTVSQNAFANCYCTPTGGNCTNEYVRGVTLNTLSNTGTTCTSGGYANYTTNAALTTTLAPGGSYSLTLDLRINSNPAAAGVWIDYDHSGTFDASEFTQVYSNTTLTGSQDVSGTVTITVPTSALTGATRLRVRSANSTVQLSAGGACTNNYFGEVEDYLITIAATDLVISTTGQTVAAGTYNSITVQNGGQGTLAGNVTVLSSTTVQSGGTLNDGCAIISGGGTFTLAAGGTLGICNPSGISSSGATGAIQNTGARSFSPDASYVYNGTAAQSTGSGLPTQVRNLGTTNSSDVTLTGPTSATQVVTVGGSGNLALNGQALTLLSNASGTALVVNSNTGVVTGATGVAQRYLATSNLGLGYRQYSAPVSGSTVADLATSGFSPEVSQAATYNSSATPGAVRPYPTVFGYDQSRLASTTSNLTPFNKGWYVPAGTSAPLAVGQGYTVNIAGNQLVDFVGTFTTGSQPMSLSRGPSADAGLALVGNPYPAPIDWSLLNQFTDRPGVDGAFWVFVSSGQYAGSYRPYVNGQGSGSIVPMGQGFFVRVNQTQSSATLTFRNAHRLSAPDATAMQRTTADLRPQVVLELRTSAGAADPLYAYAEAGATASLDREFDAIKLSNPSGLNLSSVAGSGEALAIDGRPAFVAGTELPLQVGVPAAGTYTLHVAGLNNLSAGLTAYLRDAATGQTLPLTAGQDYSFSVTATQATALLTGRFTLVFRTGAALAATPSALAAAISLYPNPAGKTGFVVGVPAVAGASQVQAELLNALGQVVGRQSAALPAAGATLRFPTAELASGVYVLRLTAGAATAVKRVVVE